MENLNTDRIKHLLVKHLLGDLENDESAELQAWIDASDENKDLFSRLSDPEYISRRHEDFSKVSSERKKETDRSGNSKIVRWAAAFLAAAAILLLALFIPHKRTPSIKTFIAPQKGISVLELPDGSKVWMKSASSITYPERFYGPDRKIAFSGEGYFEVSPAEDNPFVVDADGFMVKVTGTKFNLKSYRDDKYILAALIEGEVSVIYADSLGVENEDRMVGGQLSVFDKSSRSNSVVKTNTSIYSSWIGGVYSFESETLESILREVCRYYGYNLIVSDSSVKDRVLSGRLRMGDNAASIIEAFQEFLPGHVRLESDTIIIQ